MSVGDILIVEEYTIVLFFDMNELVYFNPIKQVLFLSLSPYTRHFVFLRRIDP